MRRIRNGMRWSIAKPNSRHGVSDMAEQAKRIVKVAKFEIVKPVNVTWDELGRILRDVRYRVWRLANMAMSEEYLRSRMRWPKDSEEYKRGTIDKLNNRLWEMLQEEQKKKKRRKGENEKDEELRSYAKGAVPGEVTAALGQYKIRALVRGGKWLKVLKGESSLPTFRKDMGIPVRCQTGRHARVERTEEGEVVVDLQIKTRPCPRVVLATRGIGGGETAILERFLANPEKLESGWRQRCFEIKEDKRKKKWFLHVTYDFPSREPQGNKEIVVGVDVGYSVPLYAAVNNGHARLGWKRFSPLGEAIKQLQRQVAARRRSMLRSGRNDLAKETARFGHGRKRRLELTDKLGGRTGRAYTTMNHQLSRAVVQFAQEQGAGVIQMEDLDGLQEVLRGSFLGARWRYEELQRFIKYKGEEAGIKVWPVKARYTSRRCSKCGYINAGFTREHRDRMRSEGKSARYECVNPDCRDECNKYPVDADYNAARNISTIDIAKEILVQCKKQGIAVSDL